MKIPVFFIMFFGVFVFMYLYIIKRYVNKTDIDARKKLYMKLFLALNMAGVVLYVSGRYLFEYPNWLYYLSSVSIGILFLFFCTAIVYDISRTVLSFSSFSQKRRDAFKRSLDIAAPIAAVALSSKAIHNAIRIEIEDVEIKIKNLKQEYKIVQLSDIHIGGLIDAKYVEDMIIKVNSLKPDLVVITGDLIDIDISKASDIMDEFKKLKSKYGTFFIVGNHEYYHDIAKILKAIKAIGIKVLENENVYIGEDGKGFNLAGVYDMVGYNTELYAPDLKKAMSDARQDSPTILLAHRPAFVEEVKSGVDLMLNGHTHGGQIFPFMFLARLKNPYISGLHRHDERLQVYVSKGTGFWGPPMRLGVSSEITNITLKVES